MIIIHASFQVDNQKEEEFLTEVKSLVADSRAESGNLSYDLMKDVEKENAYTMVEVWKDQQAVENHNTTEHFIAFGKKAQSYFTAPPEIKIYAGQAVNR